VKRAIVLSPDALRQFRKLRAKDRSRLRDAMLASLGEDDATVEARNRFRLRRPSEFADFELRADDLRVFYRVAGERVEVVLIGRKKGNHLVIDGKRFTL
jgi:mRNA-degrading endonuclease RelE of RelBE toxin-antitoxin system